MSQIYSIVDLETTGGSPLRSNIIEIAVVLTDGKEIIDDFSSLVNPGSSIPKMITKLTGITDQMVAHAPRFCQVAREIIEFTRDAIFVAHNVHFDYSFLKGEFKRLGYRFSRKTLCTIRLGRKILPSQSSYSLGKLCRALEIDIEERHRAWGDAKATTELFHLLLEEDEKGVIERALCQGLTDSMLPSHLDRSDIEALPDEVGVYYFCDEDQNIIYVGKSKNIRSRVIQHFTKETRRAREMKEKVFDIGYELTGSELLALLLESREIQRLQPRYNRAQKGRRATYGIYKEKTKEGYLRMVVGKRKKSKEPILPVANRKEGKRLVTRLLRKYNLCDHLCNGHGRVGRPCFGFQIKRCQGACTGRESPEEYNRKVEKALDTFFFPHESFLLFDEGRRGREKSLVYIEEGKVLGYGYLDSEWEKKDLEEIKEDLHPCPHTRHVQRIVYRYLKDNDVEVKVLE